MPAVSIYLHGMWPRRFAALLVELSLVATWVGASGVACDLDDAHVAHMTAMAGTDMASSGMAGMAMPGMPRMPNAGESGDQGSSGTECSLPWSAGDCTDMTSCSPAALSVPLPALVASAEPPHGEPAWLVGQLRSVSRTPEPPPPRA